MDFTLRRRAGRPPRGRPRPGRQGLRRLREPPPGRAKDDPGFDEKQWTRMAEMGLLGLPFSEEDGGVGAGPVEIGIVCQELGRVIAPEPYLTSRGPGRWPGVRGRHRRAAPGGPRRALGRRERAGLRPRRARPRLDARPPRRSPRRQDGDSWTLTGVKEPVPHGARADVLVVSAALPDGGTGLFLVEGDAAGAHRLPDVRRHAGPPRVAFDGTAATPLGEPGLDVTASIATVQDITRVMAANQALGAMQFLLPTTTEYLRSRKQFGVTAQHLPGADLPRRGHVRLAGADPQMVDWATMVVAQGDPAEVADAARRVSLQVSTRRPARRPGGDPAARRHRDDRWSTPSATVVAHLTALDHLLGDGGHHLRQLADDGDDVRRARPSGLNGRRT